MGIVMGHETLLSDRWKHLVTLLWIAGSLLVSKSAWAQQDIAAANRYLEMSIEDILSVKVSSASRKKEMLKDSAAAAFVITSEDIRRASITTIPDALRMVPGINVAQINANQWAITARGFNGRFANKLLVMIDGRTVYSPLFSGVFWSRQDTLLEDVDRIEVIRGPGAALWGANAVNGVINIITKHSMDTQGGLIVAGGGTKEQLASGVRYGHELGHVGFARAYLKYNKRDNNIDAISNNSANDQWETLRGGFRLDHEITSHDKLTLQGDIYHINGNQRITALWQPTAPFVTSANDAFNDKGWNLLTRWQHQISTTASTSLQLYYNRSQRDEIPLGQTQNTVDIDFQNNLSLGDRHNLVWGGNYRIMKDDTRNTFNISLSPSSTSEKLFSTFIQDEITLIQNSLSLTLGTKLEKRDFTKMQIQPNARLNWHLNEHHMLWGAVSKASRVPSKVELNSQITRFVVPPVPLVFTVSGNSNFQPEELTAYEIGYRAQPADQLSLHMTAFYNVYDNLLSYERVTFFNNMIGNQLQGFTYGAEIDADLQLDSWWRLRFAYSYLRLNLKPHPGSTDPNSEHALEGGSPKHQLSLRSSMNLSDAVELDLWGRYVGKVSYPNERALTFTSLSIGSYAEMDIRLGWRVTPKLNLSIVGKNLLQSKRLEYIQELNVQPSYLTRSIFAKATLEF